MEEGTGAVKSDESASRHKTKAASPSRVKLLRISNYSDWLRECVARERLHNRDVARSKRPAHVHIRAEVAPIQYPTRNGRLGLGDVAPTDRAMIF